MVLIEPPHILSLAGEGVRVRNFQKSSLAVSMVVDVAGVVSEKLRP